LLGSTYYTDHPVVPLHKTIANLNVDGLAAFDRFQEVVGVGAELSTLGILMREVAAENNLHFGSIPPQFQNYESFSRSDQMAFAWAGIPSILIMDGLNYEQLSFAQGMQKWLDWNDHIYHTPFDDIDQPIHWPAAEQHVLLLYDFILNLANAPFEPEWNKNLLFYNIRLQTIAEER